MIENESMSMSDSTSESVVETETTPASTSETPPETAPKGKTAGKTKSKKSKGRSGGENAATALGAQGRTDVLHFMPEDLTLVQLDESHPLYNPKDRTIDDKMVKNIMVNGIIQSVSIRRAVAKNGSTVVEVLAGTNRVLHAAEANKRLAKEGKELVRVPCVIKKGAGDDSYAFGVMVSENEFRRETNPVARAKLVQRYIDMGRTEAEACVQFGISGQTIRNYSTLLECSAPVQKAVQEAKIPAAAARELVKLPAAKQGEELQKMIAAGNVKGEKAKRAARNAAAGKEQPEPTVKMRGRRFLEKLRDDLVEFQGQQCQIAAATIDYVLGSDRAFRDFDTLRETVKSIKAEMGKKGKGKKSAKKDE